MVGEKALTWTVQFQDILFDDIELMLSGLLREGQQPLGYLKSFLGSGNTKDRRDNVKNLLEDLIFIQCLPKGNTTVCNITKEGENYLFSIRDAKKDDKKLFHSSLYRNVLHYSYAYDFIIENDYYSFTKHDLIEKLVLDSSNNYGTRLYDWKSAEYVIYFMDYLGVLSKNKDIFTVNEDFRKNFNEKKFEKLIRDSLKNEKLQYTNSLCEYLMSNIEQFFTTDETITVELIYKKLVNLNDKKDFLKFIPGLPRPPIQNIHTLVELK